MKSCDWCTKAMGIGSDLYVINLRQVEAEFCSKACAKEYTREFLKQEAAEVFFEDHWEEAETFYQEHKAEHIIDTFIDENLGEYSVESSDSYDRYGVSESDF